MGIGQDLRYPVLVSVRVGRRCVSDLQSEGTTLSWVADIRSLTIAGLARCSPPCCASNMVEDSSDAIALLLAFSRAFQLSEVLEYTPFHCTTVSEWIDVRKLE